MGATCNCMPKTDGDGWDIDEKMMSTKEIVVKKEKDIVEEEQVEEQPEVAPPDPIQLDSYVLAANLPGPEYARPLNFEEETNFKLADKVLIMQKKIAVLHIKDASVNYKRIPH